MADQASTTDANGFSCLACGEKFYTSVQVFPSYCPRCKKPQIVEIVAYVCENGQMILGPRDQKLKDPKTGKILTSIRLPREKDLETWGARKKTAEEVGCNR